MVAMILNIFGKSHTYLKENPPVVWFAHLITCNMPQETLINVGDVSSFFYRMFEEIKQIWDVDN